MSVLRGDHLMLAAVLLLAAGLRVAACAVWWDDLSRDPDAYRGLAERLLDGRGFAAPDGHPTAFRPPLYPFLLTGVLWAGPVGVAVLHVGLGVATVGLTADLGRRLGLGRWSLLAAALVAVDPLLLRYTPQVMTEVVCAFLATLILWLTAFGRRPFLLGIAFGLAVLSRPTFWVFGGLVAALWVWDRWFISTKHEARNPKQILSAKYQNGPRDDGFGFRIFPTLVMLGVALVAVPWIVRNTLVLGRPVLTTTHGGYTLLLANNPVFWDEVIAGPPGAVWDGRSLDAWQKSLEKAMADEGIAADDELARDRWAKARAIEHIRDRPGRFLRSVAYRLRRLWDVAPAGPGAGSLPTVVRWAVGGFYFAVQGLAVLGVVRLAIAAVRRDSSLDGSVARSRFRGAVPGKPQAGIRQDEGSNASTREPLTPGPPSQGEGGRNERASWRPALLLILAFTAVHVVYWTDARMRAPLIPAVALLAARGVSPFRGWLGRNAPDREG